MLAFCSSLCWLGIDAIFVIFSVASESPCGLAVSVLLRSLDSSCLILRACLFWDVESWGGGGGVERVRKERNRVRKAIETRSCRNHS